MRRKTHYQVLGVGPEVSAAEIKKAYRKLAKDYHPDLSHNNGDQKREATEFMMRLNEAYETLSDKTKRAHYDITIGLAKRVHTVLFDARLLDEDQLRQEYLSKVFNPARNAMVKVFSKYKHQLRELSLDIFDEQLVANFEIYVDELEDTLRASSQNIHSAKAPRSLEPAMQILKYSIAQATDALEEMRRFCQNFDYAHLTMAETLLSIATDLSKQSLRLTRSI
jgi:molecular chaperone DnaJ